MFEVRDKPRMVEKALLVRICFDKREEDESRSLLNELAELVNTLGIGVGGEELVRSREMHKKFLCGTGKAAEVAQRAQDLGCDCLVFDNELAPNQQREWEEAADITVIDREEVILDIFAKRAQTKEMAGRRAKRAGIPSVRQRTVVRRRVSPVRALCDSIVTVSPSCKPRRSAATGFISSRWVPLSSVSSGIIEVRACLCSTSL